MNQVLGNIPEEDVTIFTDGSVGENNNNGGAGAIIYWPSSAEPEVVTKACGKKCSSYRAEMAAIHAALKSLQAKEPQCDNSNIWLFTDSESALQRLKSGPGLQIDPTADAIWSQLSTISEKHNITMQWIPGHRNIDGNEAADKAAKDAASLDQKCVPLDFMTVKSAVKSHLRKKWREAVFAEKGIYSKANVLKPPAIPKWVSRKQEVTIHQLRTGKSPLARSNWARYAKRPDEERLCPNGCNEKESVEHIIWKCPLYSAQRMKHFGHTNPPTNILFTDPKRILKYMDETGHSTAPTVEEQHATSQ